MTFLEVLYPVFPKAQINHQSLSLGNPL